MKLEKDKKWKWPPEKMREWTDEELRTHAREFRDQFFRLRFQRAAGQTEGISTLQGLRKGIARAKTILRARELEGRNTKLEVRETKADTPKASR